MKRALSSSFTSTSRGLLHFCTTSTTTIPKRPTEIPFQPKLTNSLNFIGVVQSPIQFLASLDGSYWAATTLSQNQPSRPALSIPVVFHGDLAHTAASHLKPDDSVYISGHLNSDKLPLSLPSEQPYFQVMVQSFSFVQGSPYATSKGHWTSDERDLKPKSAVTSKRKAVDPKLWEDLVNNLTEWKDYRNDKMNKVVKENYPDFKHRKDSRALWLNTAPSWVLEKLGGSEPQKEVGKAKKLLPCREELGGSEPQEKVVMAKKPLPCREELGGSEPQEKVVMAKKPLPSREELGGSKPEEKVGIAKKPLPRREELGASEHKEKVSIAKKPLPGRDCEESWKDLMENPSRWWDNRANKPTIRHPDFKNKDTGEALWLDKAPQWAMEKLPLVKA